MTEKNRYSLRIYTQDKQNYMKVKIPYQKDGIQYELDSFKSLKEIDRILSNYESEEAFLKMVYSHFTLDLSQFKLWIYDEWGKDTKWLEPFFANQTILKKFAWLEGDIISANDIDFFQFQNRFFKALYDPNFVSYMQEHFYISKYPKKNMDVSMHQLVKQYIGIISCLKDTNDSVSCLSSFSISLDLMRDKILHSQLVRLQEQLNQLEKQEELIKNKILFHLEYYKTFRGIYLGMKQYPTFCLQQNADITCDSFNIPDELDFMCKIKI